LDEEKVGEIEGEDILEFARSGDDDEETDPEEDPEEIEEECDED